MRFPNYSGEWQVSSMGKVCTFRKGYGISKENLSSDGTPCILYGELYTTYKTAIAKRIKSKTSLDPTTLFHSKKNDVIIPCSGETAEDIATSVCIPYDDILLGGDLTVIRSDLDGAFLSNQINSVRKYDIARIAQGKSIVHLQADELKKIFIAYPTIEEQQKISGFIDKIDERIEVQNKIISDLKVLKKELCNKVFCKGSVVRLGDFIEEVTTRNKSNSCENVLSVSNKMGFIKQSEQFEDRTVASENKSNYKVVANSKCEIERYDEINDNINNFVSVVVKTGRINKLTPEIVRLLIDKIIVSEKVKTENGFKRTVTIFLTHVGEIELP